MQIDRRTLNLTFPVDRGDGSTIYVHSTPIGREAFDAHWQLTGRASANLVSNRTFTPRFSALALRDAGQVIAAEHTPPGEKPVGDGGYTAFLAEIHRLTMVIVPSEGQLWSPLPFDVAVARKVLDSEDLAEIDGVLCFFTLGWHTGDRGKRSVWLARVAKDLDGQTTSQTSTDFATSLVTLKPDENTGESTTTS